MSSFVLQHRGDIVVQPTYFIYCTSLPPSINKRNEQACSHLLNCVMCVILYSVDCGKVNTCMYLNGYLLCGMCVFLFSSVS